MSYFTPRRLLPPALGLVLTSLLVAGCLAACGGETPSTANSASETSPAEGQESTAPKERFVDLDGVRLRVLVGGEGPAVLLLHGFPDLAITWRHQMAALVEAGYRVIAPDLRGFGGSDAPPLTADYDTLDICGDSVGLLDALDEERAILIAHDWGAAHAWLCVLQQSERFSALVSMSVPFGGRADRPPLERMREASAGRFFYMLYFQPPGIAEAELEGNVEGVFRRLYQSPGVPRHPPKITDPTSTDGGWLDRIGLPEESSDWFSDEDLRHYTETFQRTGFRGGLSYYRNLDRNWELTEDLSGARVAIPTLFLAGAADPVLRGQSQADLEGVLAGGVADLRGVHLIPDAGHWAHLEKPDRVNQLILDFLTEVAPRAP